MKIIIGIGMIDGRKKITDMNEKWNGATMRANGNGMNGNGMKMTGTIK